MSIDCCFSIRSNSSNQLRISDTESLHNQYGSPISYNSNSRNKLFHKKSNSRHRPGCNEKKKRESSKIFFHYEYVQATMLSVDINDVELN